MQIYVTKYISTGTRYNYIVITNQRKSRGKSMNSMTDYSHPKYKDLYKEILIDHNFRYGKFSPIPYPMHPQIKEKK